VGNASATTASASVVRETQQRIDANVEVMAILLGFGIRLEKRRATSHTRPVLRSSVVSQNQSRSVREVTPLPQPVRDALAKLPPLAV
jgi:hypothetical protein